MRKVNLTDVTFIILIRLDSIQRLENLIAVSNYICHKFSTNMMIWEASGYPTGILKSLLDKKISYQFIEDKDPVLYKTKYYNQMIQATNTPYFAIWDADALVDQQYIIESVASLREGKADIVYPYNGKFLDTSDVLRELYLRKKSVKVLDKHKNKMNALYNMPMYGGAVFLNKEKYVWAGMDNEAYYGWGDEDFDRFVRCRTLNLNILRTNNCLFHLSHPRNLNSKYRSSFQLKFSSGTLESIQRSSYKELLGV